MTGIDLIAQERKRQMQAVDLEREKRGPQDRLAWLACYYAMPHRVSEEGLIVYPEFFFAQSKLSWGNAARDTKARIGQLAVAGALITAEMDRLLTAPNALERVGA